MYGYRQVKITSALLEEMILHCRSELPREACGMLFGKKDPRRGVLLPSVYIPVANVSPRPHQTFRMDPQQMISAYYRHASGRQELVGLLHSHPTAPAYPSQDDLLSGRNSGSPSHWIMALGLHADPTSTQVRVFHYGSTEFKSGGRDAAPQEIELIIV